MSQHTIYIKIAATHYQCSCDTLSLNTLHINVAATHQCNCVTLSLNTLYIKIAATHYQCSCDTLSVNTLHTNVAATHYQCRCNTPLTTPPQYSRVITFITTFSSTSASCIRSTNFSIVAAPAIFDRQSENIRLI